jgi:IS605 OrfB family transposase
VKRAIILQTEVTKSKAKALRTFSLKAAELANFLLSKRKSKKLMELHKEWYSACKKNTPFSSQVICDIERAVVKTKTDKIKSITVKFNVPRNCKTFDKSLPFVSLGICPRKPTDTAGVNRRSAGRRVCIPFKKNRSWQRYSSLLQKGWICKTYGLMPDGQIVAYLSKEKIIPEKQNVLGIDINAKHFAISVVSPDGKILYQTYLGKSIWVRRRKLMERRALLQSLNASRKLRRLKETETNFVKTNLAQTIREIIKIAKRFNAEIAIEKLKRFPPKGRNFNREVMRIPFYKFRQILSARCFDNDIPLRIVDNWHTSKWCSHCGAVGKGHSANYAIFECKCGQVVNSDRKASLAIAVKSLVVRRHQDTNLVFQFTTRRVPVNGLLRQNDVGLDNVAVQHSNQPMKADQFIGR